jgi:uncharacterized repeat protein (TIGR01451 family)
MEDSNTVGIYLGRVVLSLTSSVSLNEKAQLEIAVQNTNTFTMNCVSFADVLPAGLTFSKIGPW